MRIYFFKHTLLLLFLFLLHSNCTSGKNTNTTQISGKISVDSSWESMIYLSYLPSYDKMYEMSNEMIIAKEKIDSLGFFEFSIDFLPCDENLFRLHIIKKGDSPATLIIGGKDENHLFLIANCNSSIHLTSNNSSPPFRNVEFHNSDVNSAFNQITNLVFRSDSLAAESNASKRALIEEKLNENLLLIADTSSNFLVSLYAIYKSKFESNYRDHSAFYNSYIKKWRKQHNDYFSSFKNQVPSGATDFSITFFVLFIIALLSIIGYFIWINILRRNNRIQELSIQERKVFDLLRKGATNQEISDQCNIGLSTVKSHVSSIYSKLNIKSRKNILNLRI
jgi:DNA-binding CsgD family transcriptional regulator